MIRALSLLVALAAPASAETLRIGTEAGFPPFIVQDADGNLAGFDKAMGDEICARLDADCEWVTTEWAGIIDGLLANEYDMIIGGMAASASRAERVDFTQGYLQNSGQATYVGMDNSVDLATARIAVQDGTIYADHLAELGRDTLLVTQGVAALQAVRNGLADCAYGSPGYMNTKLLTEFRDLQIVGTDDIVNDPTAIAFRPTDDALRERVDLILTGMLSDGTINDIAVVWFPAHDDT